MHMVVGFLLASLIKQKTGMRMGLPSIRGKLEAVHALPGRMRLGSPLLEGLPASTRRKIGTEIKKIDGIDSVAINAHSGSVLILYDAARIEPAIVHGVVVKVLGLEQDMEASPSGRLTREIGLLGRALSQQIHQSSGGLMDLRSSLMLSLLALALYRMFIQGDRALPGGINLLWWTFIMAQKEK